MLLPGGPHALPLGLIYRPVTVIGADAAVPVGQSGLGGEVAYSRAKDQDDSDPLTKKPSVFAVLGVERTFVGELNINAQYLYRRTVDFVPPSSFSDPTTRLLAEQVDLSSNQ